jgi:hypothetical protein
LVSIAQNCNVSKFGLLCGINHLISISWNDFACPSRWGMRMGNLHGLDSWGRSNAAPNPSRSA